MPRLTPPSGGEAAMSVSSPLVYQGDSDEAPATLGEARPTPESLAVPPLEGGSGDHPRWRRDKGHLCRRWVEDHLGPR